MKVLLWLLEYGPRCVVLGMSMRAIWKQDWPQASTWLLMHIAMLLVHAFSEMKK